VGLFETISRASLSKKTLKGLHRKESETTQKPRRGGERKSSPRRDIRPNQQRDVRRTLSKYEKGKGEAVTSQWLRKKGGGCTASKGWPPRFEGRLKSDLWAVLSTERNQYQTMLNDDNVPTVDQKKGKKESVPRGP